MKMLIGTAPLAVGRTLRSLERPRHSPERMKGFSAGSVLFWIAIALRGPCPRAHSYYGEESSYV